MRDGHAWLVILAPVVASTGVLLGGWLTAKASSIKTALLPLAALLFIQASQAAQASPCDASGEAARQARAVADGIIAADNARDLERVLGYYAADAVLMPPGEAPVQGREAIRPRYEGLFSRFDPRIEARVEEVCADGGLAVVRGRNGGRLISRGGQGDRTLDDVYVMVLRREAEGTWRISHLMWHPASPGAGEKSAGAGGAKALAAERNPANLCGSGTTLRQGCEYSFTLAPDGYAAIFPKDDKGVIKYQLPRLKIFGASGRLVLEKTGYSPGLAKDLKGLEKRPTPEEGAPTLAEELARLRTAEGKAPAGTDLGAAEYSFVAYGADWCEPCKEELKTIRKFAASSKKARVNILQVDADVQKLDADSQQRVLGFTLPSKVGAEKKE